MCDLHGVVCMCLYACALACAHSHVWQALPTITAFIPGSEVERHWIVGLDKNVDVFVGKTKGFI